MNEKVLAQHLAIGPLDGRYADIGKVLSPYFSEYALVKYRVKVEVKWLEYLIKNIKDVDMFKDINKDEINNILKIYEEFSDDDFIRVKEIESVTNHDVKAVELFIGEKLRELKLDKLVSFVHFGCTSEDINNTSYSMMISDGIKDVWIPKALELIEFLEKISLDNKSVAMLAHTHGQPATPTTVGKEITVFTTRMRRMVDKIKVFKTRAKFNGATGTYAAINVAMPNVDWIEKSKEFVEDYLGLEFNLVTTQIENHDYIVEIADMIRHFNNILLDLDLDMWMYISMEYFKQIPVKTEVGSSTMPHKVNPIKFENSEANVDMSNAILMALSNKLPKSRMQRDLSDSSSQRNIGLGVGYSLQAITQTLSGLKRLEVNKDKLAQELNNKWEVLAEPIQTMLRKYGEDNAYNKLKELTRGKVITEDIIKEFIKGINILSEEDYNILINLTPESYVGLAEKIVEESIK